MKITVNEFKRKNKFEPADHLIKGNKILCRQCVKREANCTSVGGMYAVGYCDTCIEKQNIRRAEEEKKYGKFGGGSSEMVPESMKEERKKYFKSQIQPEREGIPSKEFVEAYPDKARKMFKERVNKAEYVWRDVPGWSTRERSF